MTSSTNSEASKKMQKTKVPSQESQRKKQVVLMRLKSWSSRIILLSFRVITELWAAILKLMLKVQTCKQLIEDLHLIKFKHLTRWEASSDVSQKIRQLLVMCIRSPSTMLTLNTKSVKLFYLLQQKRNQFKTWSMLLLPKTEITNWTVKIRQVYSAHQQTN